MFGLKENERKEKEMEMEREKERKAKRDEILFVVWYRKKFKN